MTRVAVPPAERSLRLMGDVCGLAAVCAPGTFHVADDGYNWVRGTLADSGLCFEAKTTPTPHASNLFGGRLFMLSVYDDAARRTRGDYFASRAFAFDAPYWEVPAAEDHLPILRTILMALDDHIALAALDERCPRVTASPILPAQPIAGPLTDEAREHAIAAGAAAATGLCRAATAALDADPAIAAIEAVVERDAHRPDDPRYARVLLHVHRHPGLGEHLGAATCLTADATTSSPALPHIYRIERRRQLLAHFLAAAPLDDGSGFTLVIDRRGATIRNRSNGGVLDLDLASGGLAEPPAATDRFPAPNEPRAL